ncbi:hypothetical protein [Marinobacterium lutimaris]|uniref:Uncharacterized protein n=1 Tax=Marinobacterium lutimaris TaxID=568106 RepID=A0A1H6DX49_9GAMM|nr:hypothetical protein [Marinobacterium lutimaris]SEG89654.1 hypothetical protein SAMN05444390_1153 [Marinobacterium lutimaris]
MRTVSFARVCYSALSFDSYSLLMGLENVTNRSGLNAVNDLLGDEFYDLVSKSIDSKQKERVSLSDKAHLFVPVDQGTVVVYSQALEDACQHPDFGGEVRTIANMVETFDRKTARKGEPLGEVFRHLCQPEDNTLDLSTYKYVTRKALIERGVVTNTAVLSRIQKELEQYGILQTLVPNRGPRPSIYVLNYPFNPIKPEAPKRKDVAVVDMSGHRHLVRASEEEKDLRLIDMRRQTLHRSRPHESHDMDGNPIKVYSRKAEIRTPNGETTTLEMTARTYEGNDTPVMSKQDDLKFEILLGWCLIDIRARKRLGKPLDDWYVLTPEALADHLGFTNPANHVFEMSAMIERWRDTQVTAEALLGEMADEVGEFAKYIAQDTMSQFAQHQASYKETRRGRRINALRFKLPPDVQKDLERRANNNEDELRVENVATFLLQHSNRTLMTDSFAIALNHFFWTWARNFRRAGGWSFELWEGLSQVFDYEFPVRQPDMSAAEWNRLYVNSRTQFTRMLKKFFTIFSHDAQRDWDTWTSFKGGLIEIELIEFKLVIELEERHKNARNAGRVAVKALPKRLAGSSESTSVAELSDAEVSQSKALLLEYGVHARTAGALAKKYPQKHIELCIELTRHTVAAKPGSVANPAGLLVTFIKEKSPTNLEIEVDQMKGLADSRANRRALSAQVMDIHDTSWGEEGDEHKAVDQGDDAIDSSATVITSAPDEETDKGVAKFREALKSSVDSI